MASSIQKLLATTLFIIGIILAPSASAQTASSGVYQGFSGGMMVHGGYLGGTTPAPKCNEWRGATTGIGGAARVNLWQHLRVGAEGFVSTMPSGMSNLSGTLANGSYLSSAWGGILADACWRREKVWPYVGATVGGGSLKSLYIYEGNEHDWQPETTALFNKQSFVFVDPFVGMDYCMTDKVHLTFRLDYLLAVHSGAIVQPTGPRFYLGFMFCH